MKTNLDVNIGNLLHCNNSDGIYSLFLRMVPIIVIFIFRCSCPSSYDVKKLSQITLYPFKSLTKSKTIRLPCFLSGASFSSLPVYD